MDTYSVLRWGVALVGAVLLFEAVLPGAPVVGRSVRMTGRAIVLARSLERIRCSCTFLSS